MVRTFALGNIRRGGLFAMGAVLQFGLSTPAAKAIVGNVQPLLLAGLLHLGSGLGLRPSSSANGTASNSSVPTCLGCWQRSSTEAARRSPSWSTVSAFSRGCPSSTRRRRSVSMGYPGIRCPLTPGQYPGIGDSVRQLSPSRCRRWCTSKLTPPQSNSNSAHCPRNPGRAGGLEKADDNRTTAAPCRTRKSAGPDCRQLCRQS